MRRCHQKVNYHLKDGKNLMCSVADLSSCDDFLNSHRSLRKTPILNSAEVDELFFHLVWKKKNLKKIY